MYSGLSGLDANGTALSVIGNNIANVNTVGFKGSDVLFEDMLGAAVAGEQIGQGVSVGSIISSFSQGAFENTNSTTDLAISGDGFFAVSDGLGTYYTRAGRFLFDANGTLVTPQGMTVQGWLATPDGTINTNGQPVNLAVGAAVSPPSASTSFKLDMNLNAEAIAADSAATPPTLGETFSTTVQAYDSKGGTITLTIDMEYMGNGQWNWTASAAGGTTADAGSLQFDSNGQLVSTTTDQTIAIGNLANGAEPLTLTWDLVNDTGTPNNSVTSFASPSVINGQSQDGYGVGYLQGVAVNSTGEISGFFSNGQNRNLGQVALADFRSPWGLVSLGQGAYAASLASGEAAYGAAGSGGRGDISSGTLELSNIDLAKEFVKMITAQRGFQANSRVITTSDELLTDVVNLKR
jgi:flagellar hook protein FlgE